MTTSEVPNTILGRLPEKKVGLAWPEPVDDRLNALVDLANEAGDRTSRKEIAAMLIAFAHADGNLISEQLHRYRVAQATDIQIVTGEV